LSPCQPGQFTVIYLHDHQLTSKLLFRLDFPPVPRIVFDEPKLIETCPRGRFFSSGRIVSLEEAMPIKASVEITDQFATSIGSPRDHNKPGQTRLDRLSKVLAVCAERIMASSDPDRAAGVLLEMLRDGAVVDSWEVIDLRYKFDQLMSEAAATQVRLYDAETGAEILPQLSRDLARIIDAIKRGRHGQPAECNQFDALTDIARRTARYLGSLNRQQVTESEPRAW